MARRTSRSKLYSTSQKTFDLWMLRLLYRADVRTDIDTCSFGDSDEFGCCFWFKPGDLTAVERQSRFWRCASPKTLSLA